MTRKSGALPDETIAARLVHVGSINRASDVIAKQLRRLILSGAIGSGQRLLPMPELLKRFGVSRPTLRDALRILESENLVLVQQGSRAGVRVLAPSADTVTRMAGQYLHSSHAVIADLYQARLPIEPFCARILAERKDSRDIVALRGHLDRVEAAFEPDDSDARALLFAEFHHLVVELSGNRMLSLTSQMIFGVLGRHQETSEHLIFTPSGEYRDPEFQLVGLKSCRKLVRFIEQGDASGAEDHWRQHLVNANEYWISRRDRFARVNILDFDG